jgi:hypothetical protein
LPAPELLSADEHLQTCDDCMAALATENPSTQSSTLLEQMLGEEEHLSFDRLSGHVDGTLDPVESSIVELHLQDCDRCRREVSGLIQVRAELEAEGAATVRGEVTAGRGFWKTWRLFIPALGAACALLALVWFLGPDRGIQKPEEVLAVPSPSAAPQDAFPLNSPGSDVPDPDPQSKLTVSLRDAGGTVGVGEEHELVGFGDLPTHLREAARNALLSGSVTLGRGVPQQGRAVLMGDEVPGVPFGLLQPTGNVLLTQRPHFRWKPAKGATAYSVTVFDEEFNEVASSGELGRTAWTPGGDLPRGRTYRWQVTASVGGSEVRSPVRPAPDATFGIVDAAAARDIEYVKNRAANSDLLLGIAYANAGMRKEAERSFRSLLRKNPYSELAKKLLLQVSTPTR